jgi:hypothetical protein
LKLACTLVITEGEDMAVHTYGRKERLPRLLLSMRIGHLFDASNDERRELLREVSDEQSLEKHLAESYLPVESFDDIPAPIIRSFQQELLESGRKLGAELADEGHVFSDKPGQVYSRELDAAVAAKIDPYITKRIGQLNKANPWAPWHFLNVALFLGVLLITATEETGSELSALAWLPWMVSVNVMLIVRLSKRTRTKRAERTSAFNKKYQVLAAPLLEAIHEELKKAGRRRELEDLVTNQSWPGRGMPGNTPFMSSDPGVAAVESFVARYTPVRRGKSSKPSFKRSYQATSAKKAEELCAEWLRKRGEHSAKTTNDGADGGVDIRSNKYVAQVKNYRGSVGVQPIREIYGIAAAEGKTALFFTSGAYTKAALDFADSVKMPLIGYDAALSKFVGVNLYGRMLA